jgi:GT2 family glycosyltransferase
MSQKKSRISVVTVNYNQAKVTYELLESLNHCSYDSFEVWVVDNGSTDKVNLNATNYSFPVHYIYSEKNLGFAGGNNLALKHIQSELILLLNNDTEVPKDFFEGLLSFYESHPNMGIASPKIKFYHSDNLIQFAGFSAINPITSRGFALGNKQKDDGSFDKALQIPRAHGAAMLFTQKVLQSIGLMHENYFLYYEEMDYCKLALNAGFEIWYIPNTYVLHKESVSTGKDSPLKTYYLNRNRLLYILRTEKGFIKLLAILYFLSIAWTFSSIKFLLKGKFEHLKSNFKAIFWHLGFSK